MLNNFSGFAVINRGGRQSLVAPEFWREKRCLVNLYANFATAL
ncbi:hypothetical protein ANACOL_01881 [Anaerotruncus colihominis DSM 17241]|uniref:Uncharacterized protein n=1 Tax=Anaerotruncus colihominis DSM 17241 TaxID=445972 RepID=B0PAT1_9FIRM|nr:hypothetical protein ANACOL_01881 [Anaerotruncus colihominis DSM 17241]